MVISVASECSGNRLGRKRLNSWAMFLGCGLSILFAPVGSLVPEALRRTAPGGSVVCAGIHMSDIPGFPYRLLWEERIVRSVANLTRKDAEDFLALAPRVPVRTHTRDYPLAEANRALDDLRGGRLRGAAVLRPQETAEPPR